jgi:hypothetical protein
MAHGGLRRWRTVRKFTSKMTNLPALGIADSSKPASFTPIAAGSDFSYPAGYPMFDVIEKN